MENKTELMQLRHPDYDRELTELVRSNLSPRARNARRWSKQRKRS